MVRVNMLQLLFGRSEQGQIRVKVAEVKPSSLKFNKVHAYDLVDDLEINVVITQEGETMPMLKKRTPASNAARGAYLGLYVGPNLPPLVRVPIEGLHTHEQVSRV